MVPDSNDKRQAVPMAQQALANLEQAGIARPVDATGQVVPIPNLLDSGSYSESAAQGLADLNLDPHRATGRQRHHEAATTPAARATTASTPSAAEPAAASPQAIAEPTAKEKRAAKLRTTTGRAL